MIPSGLVRLALGEVALSFSTRDCIRRSSLREGIRGDSSVGLYVPLALTEGFVREAGATFAEFGYVSHYRPRRVALL